MYNQNESQLNVGSQLVFVIFHRHKTNNKYVGLLIQDDELLIHEHAYHYGASDKT